MPTLSPRSQLAEHPDDAVEEYPPFHPALSVQSTAGSGDVEDGGALQRGGPGRQVVPSLLRGAVLHPASFGDPQANRLTCPLDLVPDLALGPG